MPSTILVAGTASHVGKSTVAAGLCRLLADRGVSVAPFKAQNMSNNARAVPAPHADEPWGEVGVSQYVQARAARVEPTTDHNPVLLKPSCDGASQLVVDGRAVGTFEAGSYYDEHWEQARAAAEQAHGRLAAEHDVVVAEGAGSIAEINLHDRDLANVETARFADASVLLVADIERGGVFASLVGTLELVPDDVRERVVGAVVTKFRGDASILEPGLREFEARTDVPVLGVVPYDDPGLPEEDSVALPPVGERRVVGRDDHADHDTDGHDDLARIGVVRLPHASNVTDVEPLARGPGVRLVYVPAGDDLRDLDAVVLPGTKNTVDDLLTCREAGLGDALADFDGPVVGLCGGYQLLGERIEGASVEGRGESVGAGEADSVPGFGLLPVVTRFDHEKAVRQTTSELDGVGPLGDATGTVSGYEIHMGETRAVGPVETPFVVDGEASAAVGAATGTVCGTYLHGLFGNAVARRGLLAAVGVADGRLGTATAPETDGPYDRAATLLRDSVDVDALLSAAEARVNY
ncbi:cobyric acid synthase [Haloarchaeobius baliensis]|uniref:cobyric acid synthase n=1 Tax=Haloarchaeobius baliensis TaxID=1670458 RepID=UPI003F881CB9